MEGWVDLGYSAMHRPGAELAISWSQVRRRNATLPSHPKADSTVAVCFSGSEISITCVSVCVFVIGRTWRAWNDQPPRHCHCHCYRHCHHCRVYSTRVWPRHTQCVSTAMSSFMLVVYSTRVWPRHTQCVSTAMSSFMLVVFASHSVVSVPLFKGFYVGRIHQPSLLQLHSAFYPSQNYRLFKA